MERCSAEAQRDTRMLLIALVYRAHSAALHAEEQETRVNPEKR